MSHLRQLLNILTQSVEAIEAAEKKTGKSFPNLADPFDPTSESEQFAVSPEIIPVSMIGSSAASQLASSLKIPGLALVGRLTAFHVSSALRVATEFNLPEILRDAGPSGLSAKEIGAKVGVDDGIISRVLRILATHYVFKEVKPNVFANNRLSSLIDTGKETEYLLGLNKKKAAGPSKGHGVSIIFPEKFVATSGISALVEHSTDEGFKSSAYLTESLLGQGKKAPFQLAYNTDLPIWEWFESPTYRPYLDRLQLAMEGTSKVEPPNAMVAGFDWKGLAPGSIVVDVGGGNGNSALQIIQAAPELKLIVQERGPVIEHVAKPFFAESPEKKKLVDSGSVKLEAHDFFETQPPHLKGKVDIFMLRFVLHDWPADVAKQILAKLHEGAGPQTRILILDQLAPYACPAPEFEKDIKGAVGPLPPSPLLANLGEVNGLVYSSDLQMYTLQNGQERTIGEFVDITSATGWKVVQVYTVPGSVVKQIECVKV